MLWKLSQSETNYIKFNTNKTFYNVNGHILKNAKILNPKWYICIASPPPKAQDLSQKTGG